MILAFLTIYQIFEIYRIRGLSRRIRQTSNNRVFELINEIGMHGEASEYMNRLVQLLPIEYTVRQKLSIACPMYRIISYTLNHSRSPLCSEPAPVAQSLLGTGGHGFDPGPQHTEVIKNGTSYSSRGTQTYGVELGLVDQVSG